MQESTTLVNKNSFRVHSLSGHFFIILDPSLHPSEDQWFVQELQPNGDIYLRLVADILNSKNKNSRPVTTTKPDDHAEVLLHDV